MLLCLQCTFGLEELAFTDYDVLGVLYFVLRRLQADLGNANFLVLRNHGLLTVGRTIADAFLSMFTLENTCRIQIDALAGQSGMDGLTSVNPQIVKGVSEAMRVQTGGMGGAFVWPSLIRKLDRTDASYRS